MKHAWNIIADEKKKETLLDGIGETNATPATTVKEQKKKKKKKENFEPVANGEW